MSDLSKLLAGIFIAGLIIGGIILSWYAILGPAFNRADYNNFNTSPQHVQAVSQRFADDCQQLAETSDSVAKKAIEQDIYQLASTVDLSTIQMSDGVRTCVNRAISDVSGGH